ncbi:26S proteasome regulatory subunit 4-like protein B [Iris pallida]|uniref:26S proteasome regulatory subunit 4-like protein B n=1 Tax=Iris pallida TaxID=29817 RepID=A0AAX6FU30_IRIPA|nr:26S proteasome regulatory subunit 4-like protein B [Iris pallida]
MPLSRRRSGQSTLSAYLVGQRVILIDHQEEEYVLKHTRDLQWEFADVACDYLLGQSYYTSYIMFSHSLFYLFCCFCH